eukprot:Sspe_Gene.76573::Locus_47848_Transcript_1_1_Confidence_1.000_Length_776::g.76573::m.76573
MAVRDFSSWPLKEDPTCKHNEWVRVSRMSGVNVYLQCRICLATWHTNLSWHSKCPDHFSGGCPAGANCSHVHIYRVQPKRRKAWKTLGQAEDEPQESKVTKEVNNIVPAANALPTSQAHIRQCTEQNGMGHTPIQYIQTAAVQQAPVQYIPQRVPAPVVLVASPVNPPAVGPTAVGNPLPVIGGNGQTAMQAAQLPGAVPLAYHQQQSFYQPWAQPAQAA